MRAAEAVAARAYTTGQDIHFAAGEYDPTTQEGQHLLAHEVVHTVQQGQNTMSRQNKIDISDPGEVTESEADSIADGITHGGGATVTAAAARPVMATGVHNHIAREEDKDKWAAAYGTRKTHTGLTMDQYKKAMGTGDFSIGQGVELQKAASAYGVPKRKTMTITDTQLFKVFPDLKKDLDADEAAAPEAKRNIKTKVDGYLKNLNDAFKVMQIDTVVAQATYLAHSFVESDQFRILSETVKTSDRYEDNPANAKLDESYLNKKYMVASDDELKEDPNAKNKYATTVNPLKASGQTSGWDQSFIGRGPLQVTHRAIYVQVIAFLEKRAEQAEKDKDTETAEKARAAAKAIKEDPKNAADPQYAFMFSAAFMQMAGGVRRSAQLQGKNPDFTGLGPESIWMTGKHLESTDPIDKPKLKADAFKRAVDELTKADEAAAAKPEEEAKQGEAAKADEAAKQDEAEPEASDAQPEAPKTAPEAEL